MRLGMTSKQPREKKSYSIVYEDALDAGDEVSAVISCTVSPEGLIAVPVLASETRCRLWVSGGDDNTMYTITLIVLTAGGEELEDELRVRVKEI